MTLTMGHLKDKLFIYIESTDKINKSLISFSKGLAFNYVEYRDKRTNYPLEPEHLKLFSTSKEMGKWYVLGDYKLGVWDEDTSDLS